MAVVAVVALLLCMGVGLRRARKCALRRNPTPPVGKAAVVHQAQVSVKVDAAHETLPVVAEAAVMLTRDETPEQSESSVSEGR